MVRSVRDDTKEDTMNEKLLYYNGAVDDYLEYQQKLQ